MASRIKNFNDWVLNEDQFYQKELNTAFWQDQQFDPSIREKLLQIAGEFYATFKLTDLACTWFLLRKKYFAASTKKTLNMSQNITSGIAYIGSGASANTCLI